MIILGTRGSELAVTQSGMVADLLRAQGLEVELREIRTEGDTAHGSLASLGGQGVFAGALRSALLDGRCDIAVHSFKDLPTAAVDGLAITATPPRVDPVDVLCARDGLTLTTLPQGARVGTGSPRRAAQLRAARPDLTVVDIRGNVPTRLVRVAPGDLDAVVLAKAGLERLGRLDAVTEELRALLPAAAQGILAVECRRSDLDGDISSALQGIDDVLTHACAEAERAVLAELGAGCAAPVGTLATSAAGGLTLHAVVVAVDGTRSVRAERSTTSFELDDARALGRAVAKDLLAHDAAKVADLQATKAGTHEAALWAPGKGPEAQLKENAERPENPRPLAAPAPSGSAVGQPTAGKPAANPAKPLAGKTILFPRADDAMARALREAGAKVVVRVLTHTVTDHEQLIRAEHELANGRWDWLVITSPRSLDLLPLSFLDPETRIATVGRSSARGTEEAGYPVALFPEHQSGARHLLNVFPDAEPGQTVLVPQSAIAAPTLVDGLRAKGYAVTSIPIYTTEPSTDVPSDVRSALRRGGYDVVILFAGSVAEAVCGLGAPRDTVCVAFGDSSAARARELGLRVASIAPSQEPQGLLEAVLAAVGAPGGHSAPRGHSAPGGQTTLGGQSAPTDTRPPTAEENR